MRDAEAEPSLLSIRASNSNLEFAREKGLLARGDADVALHASNAPKPKKLTSQRSLPLLAPVRPWRGRVSNRAIRFLVIPRPLLRSSIPQHSRNPPDGDSRRSYSKSRFVPDTRPHDLRRQIAWFVTQVEGRRLAVSCVALVRGLHSATESESASSLVVVIRVDLVS